MTSREKVEITLHGGYTGTIPFSIYEQKLEPCLVERELRNRGLCILFNTDVSRCRLGSVLQDLIYIGCKSTRHANTVIVKFGRNCPWFNCFREVYSKC